MYTILFLGQSVAKSTLFQQSIDLLQQKPGEVLAGGAFALGIVFGVVLAFILAKAFCGCSKSKHGGMAHSGKRQHRTGRQSSNNTHPAPPDGCVEIYVGNLSYDLTEAQLRKEFETFGEVKSARVISNRFNNKSKGFGFVLMPNRPEAEKAVAALNDKDILGRKIRVNEARNVVKADA